MTEHEENRFGALRYIEENEGPRLAEQVMESRHMLPFLRLFDLKVNTTHYLKRLKRIHTVSDLQTQILVPIFEQIFDRTTDGITCSGLSRLPRDRGVIYLSNHRDIILDSATMNMMLYKNGIRLGNAGIGDNLLLNETVRLVFTMMKCFVVRRSLVGKEQVRFLKQLSEFIAYSIHERGTSIWLAHRSGRSKDGNDRTNPAILKMLAMAKRKDPIEHLQSLGVVVTSCSYEWDPCDVFKVKELLAAAEGIPYQKEKSEDMVSIRTGICGRKGGVHVSFRPIEDREWFQCRDMTDKERFEYLTAIVDARIHGGYRLWPSNYVAADLLHENTRYAAHYTEQDRAAFLSRMQKRLTFAPDLMPDARRIFLSGYANPVFNRPQADAGPDDEASLSSISAN